jgi:hypothetical protein
MRAASDPDRLPFGDDQVRGQVVRLRVRGHRRQLFRIGTSSPAPVRPEEYPLERMLIPVA